MKTIEQTIEKALPLDSVLKEIDVNSIAKDIEQCLACWKIDLAKIDLFIHLADTSQYLLGEACHIQRQIGTNAACYQLRHSHPMGIAMALAQAEAFIQANIYKNVLVSLAIHPQTIVIFFSQGRDPVVSHYKTLEELNKVFCKG